MKTFDNIAQFLADGGEIRIKSLPHALIALVTLQHPSWNGIIVNEVSERAFVDTTNVLQNAFVKSMEIVLKKRTDPPLPPTSLNEVKEI